MRFKENLNNFEKELERYSRCNSNAFNSFEVLSNIRNLFNSFSQGITIKKREVQLKDVDLYRDLSDLDILINSFDEKNNFEKNNLISQILAEVRRLIILLR